MLSRLFVCMLSGFLIIFLAPASQAQVVVSNYTFKEGMQKIAEDPKILMVIMDAEEGGSSINGSTSKALLDPNTSDINKIAIVIRPALGSADWDSIGKRYLCWFIDMMRSMNMVPHTLTRQSSPMLI
jgi:hypothetical protein